MKERAALVLVTVLAMFRAGWVWFAAPGAGEAYHWLCSTRLAPAFFDGPPGTALVLAAMQGADPLAMRLVWPVLGALAGWVVWRLARELVDERTAGWSLVVLNALPVFNIAAVAVSPDMPAFLCCVAGLLFARLAWRGRGPAWGAAAFAFAGASLFRYESVLVLAGVVAGVAALAGVRQRTATLGCVAIVAACAAVLWLPLRWNAGLEWVPVAGGTVRSLWAFEWAGMPAALAGDGVTWAGAALLLGGGIFLVQALRRRGSARFLLAGSALAWAWWLFRGAHSDAAGFAALCASAGVVIFLSARLRSESSGWTPAAVVVLLAGVTSWTLHAELAARAAWKPLANELSLAAREIPASESEPFFIAEDATLAAALGLHLGSRAGKYPPVFVPEGPDLSSQFALWPSYADFVESEIVSDEYFTEQKGVNPFIGRHALFIGHDLPQTIGAAFESTIPLRAVTLPSGRNLTIFLCLNYQTLPL